MLKSIETENYKITKDTVNYPEPVYEIWQLETNQTITAYIDEIDELIAILQKANEIL